MLIAVLLGLQGVAEIPRVTVRATAEGYRAEAAAFEAGQAESVHAKIAERAADLCAGKEIKWGKFGSQTELPKDGAASPPTTRGYFQEFSCTPFTERRYLPAPTDWRPSAADEADVRRFFENYYAMRDSGRFDAAASMYQPGVTDRQEFTERSRTFNKTLGPGYRRIAKVTWYVNPSSAPQPGAYAALDFVGNYPTMYFYCGYLILYRRGAGAYEITREEQTFFHRTDGTADPDQIATMRAGACRGN